MKRFGRPILLVIVLGMIAVLASIGWGWLVVYWRECLALALLLALVLGSASVFLKVWNAYRDRKRSIATALAITCILAGFPLALAASGREATEDSTRQTLVQVTGIVLMYAAGTLGAIGLFWDRRLAKQASSDGRQAEANHLPENGCAEPMAVTDRPGD